MKREIVKDNLINENALKIDNAYTSMDEGEIEVRDGQTCLEKRGMTSRHLQLSSNHWQRDVKEYSRALVLSEYSVQKEFEVGSVEENNILKPYESFMVQYMRRQNEWGAADRAYDAKLKDLQLEKEKFLQDPKNTIEDWKELLRLRKKQEREAKKEAKKNKDNSSTQTRKLVAPPNAGQNLSQPQIDDGGVG